VHLFLHGHFVTDLHHIIRDIHLAAADAHVTVRDQLARLRTRAGKSRAIYNVVQAALEHDHQVRPRGPLRARGFGVVVTELLFEQTVCALHPLLFAQLHAVADHFWPARLPVLSGREIAFLDGAFFRKTPEAFEEEFHPFPAAQPANCFTMSCQLPFSFYRYLSLLHAANAKKISDATALGRPATVVRDRRDVFNQANVQSG
jgi:hypothetical protein